MKTEKIIRIMIELTLKREMGTPYYTVGVLEEPTTGFRCRTLEKPVAALVKNPRPVFVALPSGLHKAKIVGVGLDFTIGLSLMGTYREAMLVDAPKPSLAGAGCICVGTKFVGGVGLEGGENVMKVVSQLVDHFISQGLVSSKGKVGDFVININEDEMVTAAGKDIDDEPETRAVPNWDCIAGESDEAPLGGDDVSNDLISFENGFSKLS